MRHNTASIMRGAYAYRIILGLLLGSGCGSTEVTKKAPSPSDGKAVRAFLAKAPKGFGPDAKEPLGKLIIDVPPVTKTRRK
jgi:hypothetical protein